MSTVPQSDLRERYQRACDEYFQSLTMEQIMEATAQATQRKITLASLELIHAQRAEVQIFNELVILYSLEGEEQIRRVTPDNMVVVWKEPIDADGSFNVPFQPVKPLLVLEYVSKHNKRKDYEVSYQKYEQQLKVPYYLLFDPDNQEMILFRLQATKYVTVQPNEQGRYALPELELEVAIHGEWVRYWYRGELLPLPGDLLAELRETQQRLNEATDRADEATHRAQQEAERAQQEAERAERESTRASENEHLLEQERQARLAVEAELARLREQLARQSEEGS